MHIGIYGFGSIGRLIARAAIERGHEVVAAIDIDPGIVGKDIGELLGMKPLGVTVSKNPKELAIADIVLHATGSYLDRVYSQIATVIGMGIDVISTCETLAYPYYRYPVLARKLNELAITHGVTVLGTGINPGFLLDTLAITLSAPVNIVKRIVARRSVDAGKRREPFRRKIGIGLRKDEFRKKLENKELTGHVGYAESVLLIADAAGLSLTRVEEGQEPIVASRNMSHMGISVSEGRILGVKGYGAGYINDKEVIRVEFIAYLGASEYEEITITGSEYTVSWKSTGTPGDKGTASIIVSMAENASKLPAGLITMADILPFRPHFKP